MIKVQANCSSKMTEEQMQSIRGMGIEYLAVNFLMEDATYDGIMKFKEKAARCHLTISDAGCPNLQKCPDIHLGKPTRDLWIEGRMTFQTLGIRRILSIILLELKGTKPADFTSTVYSALCHQCHADTKAFHSGGEPLHPVYEPSGQRSGSRRTGRKRESVYPPAHLHPQRISGGAL